MRGLVHDYLGMTIDYSTPGKVCFHMDDYVHDLLNEALEDMSGEAAMPVANHLFDVNEKPEYLTKEQAELFHHLTAKILFLSKWVWPELQMAVAFLMT
jgi:hypothetical protein